MHRTTTRAAGIDGERIGLGTGELTRGLAKNNPRDSLAPRGSNHPMTKMILRLAPTEYLAIDTLLVVTLAVAAVVNAWCLSAYL